MNAIYLHPTDGFTFLENVPEKPKRNDFGDKKAMYGATKDYERALAEAIEKRMAIGNVPEYKFPKMKEGDLLPWLGTYSKDVFNTKVILSPPKEEKKVITGLFGGDNLHYKPQDLIDDMNKDNSAHGFTEGSEPVNSSMSEKEEKHTDEMTDPVEFIKRRIAQCFRATELGGAEYYPFDSMELKEIPGMERAYRDILRFLTKSEPVVSQKDYVLSRESGEPGIIINTVIGGEPVVSQDQERDKFALDFAVYMEEDKWKYDHAEQKTHSFEEHLEYFKAIYK